MTREDFYKQMNVLKDEESKVISKMSALKRKYISELPFKVGDKVEIHKYGINVGWIKCIKLADYGGMEIDLYTAKKNGEQSLRYRSFWSVSLEDVKLL